LIVALLRRASFDLNQVPARHVTARSAAYFRDEKGIEKSPQPTIQAMIAPS